MSPVSEDEITEERFLDAVAVIASADAALSSIGAAILAAIDFGIARDSRTFSRKLGIEHALVLREVTALSGEGLGFLKIVSVTSARSERNSLSAKRDDICWVQAHQNDRSEIPFFDLISVIAQQHWENLPQVRPQSEFFLRRPKNSCE